jgi:hypothetical protein
MIVFHLGNLEVFARQYLAASIISVLIYLALSYEFRKTERVKPVVRKVLGSSSFFTPLHWGKDQLTTRILVDSLNYSTALLKTPDMTEIGLLYFYTQNAFPRECYSGLRTALGKNEVFRNVTLLSFFKIFFAISAWEALLFVFTPFKFLSVFIPHFSTDLNIIVALVMGISIFESSVSTVFFFIGTGLRNLSYVLLIVAAIYSLSFLTPAMSWFSSYSFSGKILVFFVLLIMILVITFLISQLRTKANLFRSALSFTILSYTFFVIIIIFNIFR